MHEKKPPLVTNARDPRYLSLRSLQTFEARSRTNLYLIEGIRHLARAVEAHAPIESVFFDPSVLSNSFGRKLAYRLHRSGVSCVRLSPHLYRDLTLAAEPQGIGAVLRQQYVQLSNLRPAGDSLWLAVESIDSPGNLGTIIRTAEAAGVSGIFLLGSGDDAWHPATVRASMGSLFSQKFVRCSPQELTAWARFQGVATVASSPDGLLDYKALRSPRPAVLLMGSEKRGLSGHLIEASNFTVRIPMHGRCDSLNVAVATGVLLFEISSQTGGT